MSKPTDAKSAPLRRMRPCKPDPELLALLARARDHAMTPAPPGAAKETQRVI